MKSIRVNPIKKMTDIEILETVVGGIMIKDMTALTFLGYLSRKVNGLQINNNPKLNELRMAVANPPVMPRLADESKLKYARNLLALGVTL